MSRLEKRLWLFWLIVFVASVAVSFGWTVGHGRVFPKSTWRTLTHALVPGRAARKIERVSTVAGVQTIRISTVSTNIRIIRNEALNDLYLTAEGQFTKSDAEPLTFEKQDGVISIRLDEGAVRMPWKFAFDEPSSNSTLTLTLPRQYAGRVSIETMSGQTWLEQLSLGELDWVSVSGELRSRGGEIHVARLKSVTGNLQFEGESLEFYLNLTAANAHVNLKGLEHIISPKIDAQTVSGTIDMTVSAQASARVSLSSFTGEAKSNLDLKKSMQSAGALEGQLGAGGGELRLRAVSGSVRLTAQ